MSEGTIRRVRFAAPPKEEPEKEAIPATGLGDAPGGDLGRPSAIDLIRRIREQTKRQLEKQQGRPDFTTEHIPDEPDDEPTEPRNNSYLSFQQDQQGFVRGWHEIVKAFVSDTGRQEYQCPKGLKGYDRKVLHQLAEQYNLGHQSIGDGPGRYLVLKKDALFQKFARDKHRPSDRRIAELAEWDDLRKSFNPESARLDAVNIQASMTERDYEPEELDTVFRRNAEEERERTETMSVKQRIAQLRLLNTLGYFSDRKAIADDDDEVPAPSVSELLRRQQKQDSASGPPPAKRPRVEENEESRGERAMREFIASGLAPVTVSVDRKGPAEAVGISLSKRLLVGDVRGPSAAAGVPKQMFINEVDGKDVSTPDDFTKAIQGKPQFTLTLWYLRKDGFTVPSLEAMARRAEAALQAAVDAQEADEAGAPRRPGRMIEEMKCSTCETSTPLDAPAWDGDQPRFCSSCSRVTQWVVDRYEADPDSDEEG